MYNKISDIDLSSCADILNQMLKENYSVAVEKGFYYNGNNLIVKTVPLRNVNEFEYKELSGNIVTFNDAVPDKNIKKLEVEINPVQEGTGDPIPENIRPITGWGSIHVTRTGKNLLDYTKSEQGGIDAQGNFVQSLTLWRANEFIKCKPSTKYTLSSKPDLQNNWTVRLYFYNENKNFISPRAQGNTVVTVESPANAKYIKWSLNHNNTNITFNNVESLELMLEHGSTPTTYEPFGDTYDIEIPTPPGTVYGGTLNVTSGELLVNRVSKTLTADDSYDFTVGTPTNRISALFYQSDGKTNGKFLSDKLETGTNASGGFKEKPWVIWGSRSVPRLWISVPLEITSVQDFKNYLNNNPIQVLYELATSQTYHLTPQEVKTLLGANTMWADSADVTIKYLVRI